MDQREQPAVVLTPEDMRAWEARAIAAGTTGWVLMSRAGRAAADIVAQRFQPQPVLVLCGPGNNGGDGFVVARHLAERGFSVTTAVLGEPDGLKGDARRAREAWAGPIEPAGTVTVPRDSLVIDALFGIGLTRPLDDEARVILAKLREARGRVVALDIPSGIDARSGFVLGDAITAALTITFGARKTGHVLYPGHVHAGEIVVAPIGLPDDALSSPSVRAPNSPDLWRNAWPVPDAGIHKYGRGHLGVLSGDGPSGGASRLAARGGLRIGAGLVTIASPPGAIAAHAARLDAIMLRRCDDDSQWRSLLDDDRLNVWVLGPAGGVGSLLAGRVATAIAAGKAVVLDADALGSFEGQASVLARIVRESENRRVVLTPHEGEFRRLFAGTAAIERAGDKVARARAAAAFTGAIVLLKGPDTVIAAPDGEAVVSLNGTPDLATAGSGDVLAGLIGGLLAQGMGAFPAACAAAWIHGEAGRDFGLGLIAEDLPDQVPSVLRRIRSWDDARR